MTLDLFAVAQVSALWNVAAMPWLYRSLTLDFEDTKSVLTAHLLKILLKTDKKYRHYVQKLNIKMPSTEGDNSRRRLKPNVLKVLARLVPMLPMLKSFTFVSNLTRIVLHSSLMQRQVGSSGANAETTT